MKILIFCTGFLFLFLKGQAQITKYDTCQYLQQYEGEWMYINGQDTLRVYLRANRTFSSEYNAINDRLWGWHEFKKENVVIESNYQYRFMNLSSDIDRMLDSTSINLRLTICNPISYRLTGKITDFVQANEIKLIKAIADDTQTMMTWTLRHSEGYGFGTGAYGRTLPRVFTLIRQ